MASAPMEGARAAAGFAPPPGERRGGEEGEPPHRAGSGDGEGRAAPAMGKKEIEGGREQVRRRGNHRSGQMRVGRGDSGAHQVFWWKKIDREKEKLRST